jgi:hypothetical protein
MKKAGIFRKSFIGSDRLILLSHQRNKSFVILCKSDLYFGYDRDSETHREFFVCGTNFDPVFNGNFFALFVGASNFKSWNP